MISQTLEDGSMSLCDVDSLEFKFIEKEIRATSMPVLGSHIGHEVYLFDIKIGHLSQNEDGSWSATCVNQLGSLSGLFNMDYAAKYLAEVTFKALVWALPADDSIVA